MRHIIILLFFFCNTFYSLGQTYIGPLIGYDFARIQSNPTDETYVINYTFNTGFIRKSPVVGLKIEQYINKSIYLNFEFSYTQKHVEAYTRAFFAIYGIDFDYYKKYLSIRYKINNSFYLGGGVNYNYLTRIRYEHELGWPLRDHNNEVGFQFVCGVKLLNFDLEFYYYRSTSNINVQEFESFNIGPIKSLGLNLSYDIKVFDRIKLFDKKGQSCPAF